MIKASKWRKTQMTVPHLYIKLLEACVKVANDLRLGGGFLRVLQLWKWLYMK